MSTAESTLSFTKVTRYFSLPAATYDVRVVLSSATDCSPGPLDAPNAFTVTSGQYQTVAAIGLFSNADVPLQIKAFQDKYGAPSNGTYLRFVHAAPTLPAVDVGAILASTFQKVFDNVAYGTFPTAAVAIATDADASNGWFQVAPLPSVELAARAHGSTTNALDFTTSFTAQTSYSAFAVGQDTASLKALICTDDQTVISKNDLYTTCSTLP